jgi:hypothetical protein
MFSEMYKNVQFTYETPNVVSTGIAQMHMVKLHSSLYVL